MPSGVFRSTGPAAGGTLAVARAVALWACMALLGACQLDTPVRPDVTASPGASKATDRPVTPAQDALRYVALGDSYTIGTSVAEAERWPNQLAASLRALELVANLGVNGFTSRDVIEVELPELDALGPEVISLLIGVNDVVQGVPAETYRQNVMRILDAAVDRVGARRVLVVTTPDYTVTPAGGDYGDPAQQSAGIRANNAIITEVASGLGITVIDIYDLSLGAATDRSLVASDGLHPSGAQYARWVERIAPIVETMLGR